MLSWSRNGACSNNEPAHKQKLISAQRGLTALALLCSVGAVVRAQDIPPGFVARFDVTQRLEYSDNPDLEDNGEAEFFGRTLLNFGLESVTKVQRFTLSIGTEIEEFRDAQNDADTDSTVDVANSSFNLGYLRNTRNALFGADLRYRESDVSSTFFDDDFDQDGRVIDQDRGTRRSYGFTLRGAVGQDAPIGADFSWRYNEINYEGTDDPDFTDSTLNNFSGRVNFRITPRITTNLNALYRDFNPSGNGVARETIGFGAGTDLILSPVWNASLGLRYDSIDRSGGEVGTDEGVSLDSSLTRTVSNGDWGLNFSSDVATNDNGRRSFLSVSRNMDLPRGDLSVNVGVTGAGDVIGTNPLIRANYRHIMSTSQLSFGVSQRVVVSDNNDEEINTTLRASYNQQINSLSSFGVNLSFFNRNELRDNGNDGQRVNLSLNYRYDLTRDWGLVSGVSHTLSRQDDRSDRSRNTVFVGVQRSFNWSP